MMTGKIFGAACALLVSVSFGLSAQTVPEPPVPAPPPATTTPPAATTPAPTAPVPDPYTEDEFPEWVLDLRRAEIIFFGSLPFTFLLALEGVEVGRYLAHGEDPAYAPFPFRSANPADYTLEEKLLVVGSAVAISLAVSLIDFIIQKSSRRPAAP
jgi:hypothetical protein